MAAPVQPVFDDHGDSDYDDLSSSRSSDAFSPRFAPSLPALGSRVATPGHIEPDLLSLSGDTVSNADTVSDQLDREDSVESFDYIRHEDIPNELRDSPSNVEEMDEGIMMSDHTIVPTHTPTTSQRLPGIDAVLDPVVSITRRAQQATQKDMKPRDYYIAGLSKSDKPYKMPDHPMRLLFVAAANMAKSDQLIIIAKIMSAATRREITTDVITEASSTAGEPVLQPFHQRYEISISEAKSITVCVDHAVAYSHEKQTATLKNESTLDLTANLLPDFAIFFHVPLPLEDLAELRYGLFPQGVEGSSFIRALEVRHVPVLEFCALNDQARWISPSMASTDAWEDGRPLLHVLSIVRSGDIIRTSPMPMPMPLEIFTNHVDNWSLTRHLAWISKQHEVKSGQSMKTAEIKSEGSASPSWLKKFGTIFPIFMMILCFLVSLGQIFAVDMTSHEALRRDELSQALNKSGTATVNATSIIHYPTTTRLVSGTTTVGLAFPTAAEVYVAKSDQLFVALPRRSPAHVGLSRNGKSIADVDVIEVVEGVYEMNINPSDAYGQVQVEVFTSKTPPLNQTIKVELGNRLLHRVTYEQAARGVQHEIQRDVEEVHTAAKAVQARLVNNTHTALRTSFYRAKALRSGLSNSSVNAIHQVALGWHGITNSTSNMVKFTGRFFTATRAKNVQIARAMASLTKNTTLAVGSALGNTLPAKKDLARARANSLKLKEKMFHTKDVPAPITAANSTLTRFMQLGRNAGHRSRSLYTDVVAPRIHKLLQKSPKNSDIAILYKAPVGGNKYSPAGLTCGTKCSKKVSGEVTCNKCMSKNKVEGLKKTGVQVRQGNERK